MLRILIISFFLIISQLGFTQPEKVWETGELKTPESVYYHEAQDVIFVSNINGKPLNKDENGFISKMNLKGEVISLKWAEGLHAPKGMTVHKNYLYVTDIDRVAKIDLDNGEIEKFIPIEGSTFLNDMETYKDQVFVTDMKDNKIYLLKNDQPQLFKENGLTSSNGLYQEDGILHVGNKNYILTINLNKKGNPSEKHRADVGGIDGLKRYNAKHYLTSDWSGHVYKVHKNGQTERILATADKNIQAADFEYIPSKKLLLVPTFFHNTVATYRLD